VEAVGPTRTTATAAQHHRNCSSISSPVAVRETHRPRENGHISRYFATFVILALFLLFAGESSARGLPAAEGDGAMKVVHGSLQRLLQEVRDRWVEAVRVGAFLQRDVVSNGRVVVTARLDWSLWSEWRLRVGRGYAELTEQGATVPAIAELRKEWTPDSCARDGARPRHARWNLPPRRRGEGRCRLIAMPTADCGGPR
jgi:hypothetical protein